MNLNRCTYICTHFLKLEKIVLQMEKSGSEDATNLLYNKVKELIPILNGLYYESDSKEGDEVSLEMINNKPLVQYNSELQRSVGSMK